jgi:hypothetical protein
VAVAAYAGGQSRLDAREAVELHVFAPIHDDEVGGVAAGSVVAGVVEDEAGRDGSLREGEGAAMGAIRATGSRVPGRVETARPRPACVGSCATVNQGEEGGSHAATVAQQISHAQGARLINAAIHEEVRMGAEGSGLRHCYVCDEWLPEEKFWRSRPPDFTPPWWWSEYDRPPARTEPINFAFVFSAARPEARRICKTCQREMHRRPSTLCGLKVAINPPPTVIGKCLIALCTAAAAFAGLCFRHHAYYRVRVETENGRMA